MNFIKKTLFFLREAGKNVKAIESSVIDFYHVTIILEGKLTYIVDGQEITVKENDALLLVPGSDIERLSQPEYTEFIIFNFHATKENELSSNLLLKNAVSQPIKTLLNTYHYTFFQSDEFTHFKDAEYKLYDFKEKNKVEAILHNLFNCILIDLFDSFKCSTKNQHVMNALKYINDNITEPLTLDSVSKAIHLSKEYTARVFKRETGITVTQYINQQKLSLAKNMLVSNEFDLQSISEKVGYQNYNYFSRIFKKHFGITPIELKTELKKAKKISP